MPSYLTIKEERHMAELYRAGWSEGQIAGIYERSRSTVQKALNRQGVERRKRGAQRGSQRLSNKDFELTAGLYERGMSITHIAKLLGRDERAIIYRLERAGIKRRTTSEAMKLAYDSGRREKKFYGQRGPGRKAA